jgi:hypothetical protein
MLNQDQIELGGVIEGFFQINLISVDSQTVEYGYYHNRELEDGEEGFDNISTWLFNLLKICEMIDQTKYVAIKDTESFSTWLEFILNGHELNVSVMQLEDCIIEDILTSPKEQRLYPEWRDIKINKDVFKVEVVNKTKKFIADLSQLNPVLSMSKTVIDLQSLLNQWESE